MGSLIKMFKPSKKSNNKENVPAVSFATNSLKVKKDALNDSVYAGEPKQIDLRLKSPYSVISNVKHKKGPMSCPGAPIDENFHQNRENLLRNSKRKVKDDSEINRRSELLDEQNYRNLVARQHYDMSMSQIYDSDEEDEKYKQKYRAAKAEIAILKGKMEKTRAKWREEKAVMTDAIDDLSNENYQIRKTHDRLRHKYNEIKANIEVEKRMKCDVLRMLQEANEKIERLEKSGAHEDSLNNSSLLIPTFSELAEQKGGAGEALCCFPDGSASSGVFSYCSSAHLIGKNVNPMSLEDDLNAQDEVRVFRSSEQEENEDEDEEMTELEELELSEPVESVRSSESSGRAQIPPREEILDTVSLALEHQEPQMHNEPEPREHNEQYQRQKYSRTSSWLKRNSINPDDNGSSDSSEEERLSLIERQLKKKGSVVKYNPPRVRIHDKHYKRFGKNERSALAEFEYLQDMSTDVSGMQSSPELGQLMGQLQLKK